MFDALLEFWQNFVQWLVGALDWLARAARYIIDWFVAVAEAVADFFVALWSWFWRSLDVVLGWLKYVLDWVWDLLWAISSYIVWGVSWLGNFLLDWCVEIYNKYFSPAWAVFVDWLASILSWASAFLINYGWDILLFILALAVGWAAGGLALAGRLLSFLFSKFGLAVIGALFLRFLYWLAGLLGGGSVLLTPTALRLLALLAAVMAIWAFLVRYLFVDLLGAALVGGLDDSGASAPNFYNLVRAFVLALGGTTYNANNLATFAVEMMDFLLYVLAVDILLPVILALWIFAQIRRQVVLTFNLT